MLLSKATKYINLLTTVFSRRFSYDGAARPSATPSRQRRAGVNEDTAETSVLRGLARLNRLSLIWLTELVEPYYGETFGSLRTHHQNFPAPPHYYIRNRKSS